MFISLSMILPKEEVGGGDAMFDFDKIIRFEQILDFGNKHCIRFTYDDGTRYEITFNTKGGGDNFMKKLVSFVKKYEKDMRVGNGHKRIT